MSGRYTVRWGILGEGTREESDEMDLEDALRVAQANGGTIFDAAGQQLTAEDIQAELHPYRRAAEEIVGTLMHGFAGVTGQTLEIQSFDGFRIGSWTVESAVAAIEKCLEGSGLS
jgi:hypothetical protein